MKPARNEIWHRPEFQDRRDELILYQQAAAIAGVTFNTVSTYKERFTDFPTTVLTFSNRPDQMIHEGEFREWHKRYLATRGQKGRPNYVAPTSRQRSEPELRAHLAELRGKREALQGRLDRLDARIAKEEARLNDIHVHQESERALGDAVALMSQIDADHRDTLVETVLDRAEQQWLPTVDIASPAAANDPVTVAFPPDAPPPASPDPAEHAHDTVASESGMASQAHLQR